MYREQLSDYLYEQAKSDWDSKPIGKKGEPPKKPHHPKFTDNIEEAKEQDKQEIPPDIGDIIPVEWMEDTE